jgi:hypothetical protein
MANGMYGKKKSLTRGQKEGGTTFWDLEHFVEQKKKMMMMMGHKITTVILESRTGYENSGF